jgi:hypothetical protein
MLFDMLCHTSSIIKKSQYIKSDQVESSRGQSGQKPFTSCYSIAYTLNIDKVMMICNETLPILGYSTSKSKIGIFVILSKKSKITIFGPFDGNYLSNI